jgi:hypothetical protein
MPSAIRTRSACLAHAETQARSFSSASPGHGLRFEIRKDEIALLKRQALINRVRRARLDESAGSIGVTAAIVGLLFMFGKCGPALLPWLFN